VNESTQQLAPSTPVKLIGHVLEELFEFMAIAPSDTDVLLGKVDLSDGFWRMIVKPSQRYNFCYVMPQPEGEPVRIVIPSALQMGWRESPGYFCAATETGRDVADWMIESKFPLPPHPMESYMMPHERPATGNDSSSALLKPWRVLVYVDDYIVAVLSHKGIRFIQQVARATLFGIHAIFPPPAITGHKNGKDSISQKKLEKGDARLLTKKEVLGFDGDGAARTWALPEKKRKAISLELKKMCKKPRVERKRLEKLTGKLVNATRIAPAAKALLTPFYKALAAASRVQKVKKKDFDLYAAMQDMDRLLADLTERPTHVMELVRADPSAIAMVDASTSQGLCVVWFSREFAPTVWRMELPEDIKTLVNQGDITINDLETICILAAMMLLPHLTTTKHRHFQIFTDSMSATWWTKKLVAMVESVVASRILRALAMHQRAAESAIPEVTHWPGEKNPLADAGSRSFQRFHAGPHKGHDSTSDKDFLTLFSSTFSPPPQSKPWQAITLTRPELSQLTSLLRGKPSKPAPSTRTLGSEAGGYGWTTSQLTASPTATCGEEIPRNNYRSYSPLLPKSVRAIWEWAPGSNWDPLVHLSATSARCSNWLASETRGNHKEPPNSTEQYLGCTGPTKTRTLRHDPRSPYRWKYSRTSPPTRGDRTLSDSKRPRT
jgi:hypothetical protein